MIFILILVLKIVEAFTSTISTILLIDEKRIMSSILSFIQVIIWFLIIKLALDESNEILIAISYAAGYSIGTYLASFISTRLSKKKLFVQVITNKDCLFDELKKYGYSGSIIKGYGLYGRNNYILFSFINNKRKDELISIIKTVDSNAFISINQNKELINGYFSHKKN